MELNVISPQLKRQSLIIKIFLIFAGVIVYTNSFAGVFLFDDRWAILENRDIRQLWPPGAYLFNTTRPLTNFTFALNFAMSGYQSGSYHAFNLVLHIFNTLVLFAILCRTFRLTQFSKDKERKFLWMAGVVSLIWCVHPMQTASVTYIVQRSESLMGCFYLLTLYAALRFMVSTERKWNAAAIFFCLLGMLTKPIMVTAPLMVLFYDRIFMGLSFKKIFKEKKVFYAGLAATWIPLLILVMGKHESQRSAGFDVLDLNAFQYAINQPGVIVHYLKLAFYPAPLVFDYAWVVSNSATELFMLGGLLAVLIFLCVWSIKCRPALGFLGTAFFLLILPSSGFIPLNDLAFEHRMYLPLAPLIALTVVAGEWLFLKLQFKGSRQNASLVIFLGMAVLLGYSTVQRNKFFHDRVKMWKDVVTHRPDNPRAHHALAHAYYDRGEYSKALDNYNKAIRIHPFFEEAYLNRGILFGKTNHPEFALTDFNKIIQINEENKKAFNNRGNLYLIMRQYDLALEDYSKAISLDKTYAEAYANRGALYKIRNQNDLALADFTKALDIDPHNQAAYQNRSVFYRDIGDQKKALKDALMAKSLGYKGGDDN